MHQPWDHTDDIARMFRDGRVTDAGVRASLRQQFPLVFEENCNYGFRRNLWGMKPVAVPAALLGLAVAGALLSGRARLGTEVHTPTVLAAVVINLLLVLAWVG